MARYSRDEVEEILRRALDTQPVEELSHDELIDVALEAGIDPQLVESAAEDLALERALGDRKDKIVHRRKTHFLGNLWTFAAVNAPLMLIDLMSGPGWWVQWVMGTWAIGLALMGGRAYFPNKGELDAKAKRQLQRAGRRRKKQRPGESDLERAIDAGVRAMVDAAAKKMSERDWRHRHQRTRVGGVAEVIDAEVTETTIKRQKTSGH